MIFIDTFALCMFSGRLSKPPNRKKYDEDVAQCNVALHIKENQLVTMTYRI